MTVSFAANVVQFVEFTTKIISQTTKIHNSKNPGATNLEDIRIRIERHVVPLRLHATIKAHLDGKPWVKRSPESRPATTSSRFKSPIAQLHSQIAGESLLSDEDAEAHDKLEYTDMITKLTECDRDILWACIGCEEIACKLQLALAKLKGTRATIWLSLAAALKTIWSETELQLLRNRLENSRKQMTMLLLVSIRKKVGASLIMQKELRKDVYESTESIRSRLDHMFHAQEQWKGEIIQTINQDHGPHHALDDLKHLSATTLQTSLSPKSQLKDPLENENENLYWITGKPAAGKSTLLKFIYNDIRTTQHLTKWAKGKRLISCASYLWNNGTQMQMFEEGMLRTLLHAALLQAPELGAELFPSKMEEFLLFADPWHRPITSSEVKSAFELLLEGAKTSYKLFLFIDGLDEFDGDHNQPVAMIRRCVSPHVKTCVSSRAWPVFEDGFQQQPRLRLETITYKDIKRYVTSRFSNSPGYLERQLDTPDEVNHLIENISRKSSGVFLWVRLVTDSLLKGLENGDRLEELQHRFDIIPEDLEELFWKILTHAEKEHSIKMSQLFQIMRRASEPLRVLDFSYADDPDPEVISKTPYGLPDPQPLEGRARRMRRRLKTCCKGLLEAEPDNKQTIASTSVTYLHRTVRDYLDRPGIWSKFLALQGDAFIVSHRMYNIAQEMLIQKNETGLQIKLLEQLDEVASYSAKPKLQTSNSKHWSSLRKGSQTSTSFMHLAIQLQLHEYIQYALPQALSPPVHSLDKRQELANMLMMATLHYDRFTKDPSLPQLGFIPTSISLELVTLFLEKGAGPNLRVPDTLMAHGNIAGEYSAWEAHLREPDRSSKIWAKVSELFLKYKADPVFVNSSIPNIPPHIVILAQRKEKERRDEMVRQTMKKIGSIFHVGKWRGLSRAKVVLRP
ncbi:hypothetical protein GQ44DRAFT_796619 [Phaeosphaeriaceae sp. PMI808]|nr:hypothetical protein GQ44DRAFT_796619 [Phaeosphaeriaceae sp. PMI808]